jgi:N-acyl homoserine lactone hydrolase
MSAHSIWIVEYGYVDGFPASNLFAAQPNEGFRRMPYCFGVIRTADECVLVDAGF